MLSTIRNQPADVKTLFDLQKLLIAEVTLAEGRVRENKALAKAERGKRLRYFETRAGASAVDLLLEGVRRRDRIPLLRPVRAEARLLQHT